MRAKARNWVIVALLAVVGAVTLLVLQGSAPAANAPLDPQSAKPQGAKALVAILDAHGIPVSIAEGRDQAADSLSGSDATLVLTAAQVQSPAATEGALSLIRQSARTVILDPTPALLQALDFGEISDEVPEGVVDAGGSAGATACARSEFARVGEIEPTTLFTPAAGVSGCFSDGDGRAAVLIGEAPGGGEGAILDATSLFDNAHLAERGNAALAFALIGQGERAVWYVPSAVDLAADSEGTLGGLTPGWVTPVILLLVVTAVVAGIASGRRFGPLVEERLPVTVRASETMLGRARLLAAANDVPHAASALRAGATAQLATAAGLSRHATGEQVARAYPQFPELVPLLTGPLPEHDAALIAEARSLGTVLDAVLGVDSAPIERQLS